MDTNPTLLGLAGILMCGVAILAWGMRKLAWGRRWVPGEASLQEVKVFGKSTVSSGAVVGWLIPVDPELSHMVQGDATAMKATLQAGSYRVAVNLAKDGYCIIEIHNLAEERTFPVLRDHISHMLVPAD